MSTRIELRSHVKKKIRKRTLRSIVKKYSEIEEDIYTTFHLSVTEMLREQFGSSNGSIFEVNNQLAEALISRSVSVNSKPAREVSIVLRWAASDRPKLSRRTLKLPVIGRINRVSISCEIGFEKLREDIALLATSILEELYNVLEAKIASEYDHIGRSKIAGLSQIINAYADPDTAHVCEDVWFAVYQRKLSSDVPLAL